MRARESGKGDDFFIVETDSVPILGQKSCVDLEFIDLVMAIGTSPAKPTPVTRNHLDLNLSSRSTKRYSRASGFFLANAISALTKRQLP